MQSAAVQLVLSVAETDGTSLQSCQYVYTNKNFYFFFFFRPDCYCYPYPNTRATSFCFTATIKIYNDSSQPFNILLKLSENASSIEITAKSSMPKRHSRKESRVIERGWEGEEVGGASLARIDHSEETEPSVGEETVCHFSGSAISLPLVSAMSQTSARSPAPRLKKKRKLNNIFNFSLC